MAVTVFESGTTSALTIGVPKTLNTVTPGTADGAFQLMLDTSNLVSADVLEIKLVEKTTGAGDPQVTIILETIDAPLTEPMWTSPTFLLFYGWDWIITQTAGTGRVFKWRINQV